MRIEKCRIRAFGRLIELELGELDHPLVIISGSNEAGKSTFFEFLKTMLFGIYPTKRASHRYVPWSGEHLDGELTLRLGDGTRQTVTRRLRSTPEGVLANGGEEMLRNQTLPAAGHVSREVFDTFYALDLEDLARIHGRPWEEVQQRLLSELSPDTLRPVSKVVRELSDEANSLWRPDRRGRPAFRRLEEQLRQLRRDALEAAAREREVRALADKVAGVETRLDELHDRRVRIRTRLRELEATRPLALLEQRRQSLEEQVGNREVLDRLPHDVRSELGRLQDQEREAETALQEQQVQLERVNRLATPLEPFEQRLLDDAFAVRHWKQLLDVRDPVAPARARRDAASAHLGRLLGSPAGPDPETLEQQWARVEEPLAALVEAFRRTRREHTDFLRRSRPGALAGSPAALGTLAALVWAAGAWMSGAGVLLPLLAGSISAAAALIGALRMRRAGGASSRRVEEIERQVVALMASAGLSCDSGATPLLENYDSIVAAHQQAVGQREHLRERRREEQQELAPFWNWHESLTGLAADSAPEGRSDRIAARSAAGELIDLLHRAETRHRQNEFCDAEAARLGAGRARRRQRLEKSRQSRRAIEAELAGIDADIDRAVGILELKQRALVQLEECSQLLENASSAESAGGLSAEAAHAEIATLEEELDTLIEESRRLSAEQVRLTTRMTSLADQPAASEVEGQVLALQADRDGMRRDRDRLVLLSTIVQRAQQRFRETHQPDVLRRASSVLGAITGQRYRRLDFNREHDRLEVYNGSTDALPVSTPLSQGTRDQIYLALRLAVIGHLDHHRETLPLFLDEVLVNWDKKRRLLGYGVLAEVVQDRQVFVFTCHDWLACELEEHAGGFRVELGR